MSEEVTVVVRLPVRSLVEDVRARHSLREEFFDIRLEGDSLVLLFRKSPQDEGTALETKQRESVLLATSSNVATVSEIRRIPADKVPRRIRRRRSSRRNRMRTRGWQVAAKIVNSQGQTAIVYKPFVQALFGKQLTPAQQRALVADILRSNGNNPTESSIEYFLTNTLEYLAQVNKPEVSA